MDRCVEIILNSYGIVVTLVPSSYYSLFLKKQTNKKTHHLKCLPVGHVLLSARFVFGRITWSVGGV